MFNACKKFVANWIKTTNTMFDIVSGHKVELYKIPEDPSKAALKCRNCGTIWTLEKDEWKIYRR